VPVIGPSSIPDRVFVDENGVWWRDFGEFTSLVPTYPFSKDDGQKVVAMYVRVKRPDHIVEGDPATEVDLIMANAATPGEEITLEELSVGYEARWHEWHVAYVPQCADCRRERKQGMR